MLSCGLDISTFTGIALVGDGDDRGKEINFPKARGFERLQLIAEEVRRTLEMWQPDVIIVESYAMHHVSSIVTVVECGTFVKAVLYHEKRSWIEVNPTALKKWTTGKGNAKKEQMAIAAAQRWNYKSPSNNIVDAICLAKMGQLPESELLKITGVSKISI